MNPLFERILVLLAELDRATHTITFDRSTAPPGERRWSAYCATKDGGASGHGSTPEEAAHALVGELTDLLKARAKRHDEEHKRLLKALGP